MAGLLLGVNHTSLCKDSYSNMFTQVSAARPLTTWLLWPLLSSLSLVWEQERTVNSFKLPYPTSPPWVPQLWLLCVGSGWHFLRFFQPSRAKILEGEVYQSHRKLSVGVWLEDLSYRPCMAFQLWNAPCILSSVPCSPTQPRHWR